MMREMLRDFFLWCTIINYAVLIVWFLFFMYQRPTIRRLHGRWFRLSDETFDALHYGGMSMYKLAIILFNLVPYLALQIVG